MIFGSNNEYEKSEVRVLIESLKKVELTPKIVFVEPKYTGFYIDSEGRKVTITYDEYEKYLPDYPGATATLIGYHSEIRDSGFNLHIATCPIGLHGLTLPSMSSKGIISEEKALKMNDFSQAMFEIKVVCADASCFYIFFKGRLASVENFGVALESFLFGTLDGIGTLTKSQEMEIKNWLRDQNKRISKSLYKFFIKGLKNESIKLWLHEELQCIRSL